MGELWRRLSEGKFEPRPTTWKSWLGILAIPLFIGFAYLDSWKAGCGGDERRHAALSSRYCDVRARAAFSYGKYPPIDDAEVRSVAPRLLELVFDPDPNVRTRACFALGELGRRVEGGVDRKVVIAALIFAMKDSDERVREQALRAIAGACDGVPCGRAIGPVVSRTTSSDLWVRLAAIRVLRSIAGADDAAAVNALDLRAARGDERERDAAREALEAIRTRRAP